HADLEGRAASAAAGPRGGDAGECHPGDRGRPRPPARPPVPAVLRAGPVSEAGALPPGAPPFGADRGRAGVRHRAGLRLVGGAPDEHRLVLPPRLRAGTGSALVGRTGHGAGPLRVFAGADRLLLRLGAGTPRVV